MDVVVHQRYKHFKGMIVEVLALAKHSEDLSLQVVYKHIDTDDIWVRPLSEFTSKVDKVKYPNVTQEYRFEPLND